MTLSKSQQKQIKKFTKKVGTLTIVLAVAFLALGAGAGYFAISTITQNDKIQVLGQTEIVYQVQGGTTTYIDDGILAIVWGQNISDSVQIDDSTLTGTNGTYEIDLSKPGDYYIKYTISHFSFGTVVKYRTITVEEVQP